MYEFNNELYIFNGFLFALALLFHLLIKSIVCLSVDRLVYAYVSLLSQSISDLFLYCEL